MPRVAVKWPLGRNSCIGGVDCIGHLAAMTGKWPLGQNGRIDRLAAMILKFDNLVSVSFPPRLCSSDSFPARFRIVSSGLVAFSKEEVIEDEHLHHPHHPQKRPIAHRRCIRFGEYSRRPMFPELIVRGPSHLFFDVT